MGRANRFSVRGLYKSGDRFFVDLAWKDPTTGEARRHREKLPPGISLAAAKEHTRLKLNAAMAGTLTKGDERTLSQAFGEYIQWRITEDKAEVHKQKASADRFVAFVGDGELTKVSSFTLERFKKHRADGGAGPATTNRDLAVVKHAYQMFAKWRWIPRHLADSISKDVELMREPPGRDRELSDDEEGRLLAAIPNPGLRRMVVVALMTALRQGNLIRLRVEHVNLITNELEITRTKGNRKIKIPIVPALLPTIQEAIAASESGALFETRWHRAYSESGVRSSFREAVEAAGIDDLHFHDLRHSCASRLQRAGVQIEIIQRVLDHSSITMTMRYIHTDGEAKREALGRLSVPGGKSGG